MRQHVTDDLLSPRHTLPFALTEAFLVKRLEDELGFSNDAARWTVISWAEALGRADPVPVRPVARTAPVVSGEEETDPALRAHWAEDLARASRPVRLGIIANLAKSPERENIRILISGMENDDWAVRSAAFDALCDPETGAAALLIDGLHDAPDGLAWRIVLVLGALRARDAVGSLIPLLERSPVVCDAAIWALGEIGDRKAATPLMDLVRHADNGVVLAAEEALRKIGG